MRPENAGFLQQPQPHLSQQLERPVNDALV